MDDLCAHHTCFQGASDGLLTTTIIEGFLEMELSLKDLATEPLAHDLDPWRLKKKICPQLSRELSQRAALSERAGCSKMI